MDLGQPIGMKSEPIGQLGLLQEFAEPRRRRASRRTLNFGEEADFHADLKENCQEKLERGERYQPRA